MSADVSPERELDVRAAESGLARDALTAVYLRGAHAGMDAALARVDAFVVHALTRETRYARDRDLVPAATTGES